MVDLLTTAADGAKSLIDASDRLILFIEIARLFGTLGYHRKAAFFSRQVAQLYLQQENRLAAISSMQVLAMTTQAYRVQSRASTDHALYQVTQKFIVFHDATNSLHAGLHFKLHHPTVLLLLVLREGHKHVVLAFKGAKIYLQYGLGTIFVHILDPI